MGQSLKKQDHEPVNDTLTRIFEVIAKEAQSNASFSKKLAIALSKENILSDGKALSKKKPFDTRAYHAVNILRQHGENILRGKLEQIRNRENLKAIARASSLTLEPKALRQKATVQDIVDGIVKAAIHYDNQRNMTNL